MGIRESGATKFVVVFQWWQFLLSPHLVYGTQHRKTPHIMLAVGTGTPVSVKGTPWSSPVGQCIKRFCYFSRLTTKRSCWIRGLHCRPRDADFGFSSKDDSLVLFLHIFGCSSAPVMFTDIDIKGLIESVATLQRGKSVVTESLCGSKRFCNARRVTRLTNAPNTILKVQECVNGNG